MTSDVQVKLTKAQIENLRHILDHGKSKPKSPSGYWCRTHGLAEWVFDDADPSNFNRKIIGEKLTDAGLTALSSIETGGK